jgi:uncharacterized membrane protein
MDNYTRNNTNPINPAKHSGMVVVAYILTALGYFTLLSTGIVGLILAYIKRGDVRGTYLESHCTLLIKVFWWSTVWYVIGWIFAVTVIGLVIAWPIWVISYVWTAYKLIKGFLRIHAEQAV